MSDPLADLPTRWREDADVLDRYGRSGQADRLRERADEVEDAIRRREMERVTVAEAAQISGYSEKHIRRMVRNGKITADRRGGEGGRILIQRGNVPRKPGGDSGGDDDDDSPSDRHVRKSGGDDSDDDDDSPAARHARKSGGDDSDDDDDAPSTRHARKSGSS